MLDNLLSLYPNYTTWYGPTFHKSEGRYYIYLYNKDTKKRTTIAYAKAIIQCKLNRLLNKNEEVDHIDNNKVNDTVENLQIITKLNNTRKTSLDKYVEVTCMYCSRNFNKLKSRVSNKVYCSNSCRFAAKRV